MTREEWRKRQAQWERFHRWEAAQRGMTLSSSERLAEIGALVDFAYRNRPREFSPVADAKTLVSGLHLMQERLAVLSRAT